jgi:hypothetical protein
MDLDLKVAAGALAHETRQFLAARRCSALLAPERIVPGDLGSIFWPCAVVVNDEATNAAPIALIVIAFMASSPDCYCLYVSALIGCVVFPRRLADRKSELHAQVKLTRSSRVLEDCNRGLGAASPYGPPHDARHQSRRCACMRHRRAVPV